MLLKFCFNNRIVIFHQNNNSKYIAKATKEWLLKQPFSIMKWFLQSLHLNFIRHFWSMLKQRLNHYPMIPIGLVELWKRVLYIFCNFTLIECNNIMAWKHAMMNESNYLQQREANVLLSTLQIDKSIIPPGTMSLVDILSHQYMLCTMLLFCMYMRNKKSCVSKT